jgi:hypothetical protein
MITCPGCFELRKRSQFVGLEETTRKTFFYCNFCRKEDERYDNWVDIVLRNVHIPYYETPIYRYIDPNIIASKPA